MQKHQLSAEVEAASGGKQVVLCTSKGQPTHMNVIPAFRLEELGPEYGTGLHPAFIVDGREVSEIYIATYQAVIRDGEALSLPGEDPAVSINFDQARAACSACGPGFHLMTNWEWAAIALWCARNGYGQLHGNTSGGQSHIALEEAGIISDRGRTLTGSGPDSWRHDGTPHGISDLVGNVWEWVDGLKLVGGKILMPMDNNIALPDASWPDAGARISGCDGVEIRGTDAEDDYDSSDFAEASIAGGFEAPLFLKQALLCPAPGQDLSGHYWVDSSEDFEALPLRGGSWRSDSNAGLAALNLYFERSSSGSSLGFRPAFIG